jgi:predicted dehydrogenase
MEPVNMLLVGCGMMGARHLRGYAELETAMPGTLRLAAVCDMRQDLADKVAAEAEQILGYKPKVYTSLAAALAAEPGLQAADIVTDHRSHDQLVLPLFEKGVNVICEKPFALTVARGQRMVQAAKKAGCILAEAENNRRDPMSRLAKACLDAGLIGKPNFVLQVQVHRGGGISATAWRHRLASAGLLLDGPMHVSYMLDYLFGPMEGVCAQTQLVQNVRQGKDFYGNEVRVDVDAEDVFAAILQFKNGMQGSWTCHLASSGEGMNKRLIVGSEGTLAFPSERSGGCPVVQRGQDILTGDALVAQLPNYQLNEVETKLFGERPSGYTLKGVETDRKLQAAIMHDFAEAIRTGRPVESDGVTGVRSLAYMYAIMESGLSGQPVTIEQVLSGQVHAYQDKVEMARP